VSGPVLVTGAAGFIGAAVVRRLAADGIDTVALVRDGARAGRLAGLDASTRMLEADLTDPDALFSAVESVRPAACVHLAAGGAVAGRDELEALVAANTLASARLAEALAAAGCRRLVTAGSSSEYGPCDEAMDEERAPRPDDVYGVSKLAGGLLAAAVGARTGMGTMHLRIFSAYGPGEDPRRLVPSVAELLLSGLPVELTGGRQVRDFVYVSDVADAFARALQNDASGVTLNVGSGRQTSVRELCLTLCELTSADPRLLRFDAQPYRPRERFSWRADTAHAERVLGWRAQTPLREGLRRTVSVLQGRAAA
jgi:polyisoprenyl-phosphate glycosyltransferase